MSEITSDYDTISAKTIGGTLMQIEKLLNVTAKELGSKVHVLVEGVKMEKKSIQFDFVVTTINPKSQPPEPAR